MLPHEGNSEISAKSRIKWGFFYVHDWRELNFATSMHIKLVCESAELSLAAMSPKKLRGCGSLDSSKSKMAGDGENLKFRKLFYKFHYIQML